MLDIHIAGRAGFHLAEAFFFDENKYTLYVDGLDAMNFSVVKSSSTQCRVKRDGF